MVNVDTKVIYRRYASLFFICSVSPSDNELVTLEVIHRYVEVLDRYFGNVSYWLCRGFGHGQRLMGVGVRTRFDIQLSKSLRSEL